jgi:hypothetical protein
MRASVRDHEWITPCKSFWGLHNLNVWGRYRRSPFRPFCKMAFESVARDLSIRDFIRGPFLAQKSNIHSRSRTSARVCAAGGFLFTARVLCEASVFLRFQKWSANAANRGFAVETRARKRPHGGYPKGPVIWKRRVDKWKVNFNF